MSVLIFTEVSGTGSEVVLIELTEMSGTGTEVVCQTYCIIGYRCRVRAELCRSVR